MLADDGMFDAISSDHGGPFPGVYQLHALDEHRDFLRLSRLLSEDPLGVLYIGAAANILYRVSQLKKSVSAAYRTVDPKTYAHLEYSDVRAHQTGKKIVNIPRLAERFPFERLCVTVKRNEGAKEEEVVVDASHFKLEDQLLQTYAAEYGERPPLND